MNNRNKHITNLTKQLLTFCLIILTFSTFGQKQRLVGDNSRFFCVSDSINYYIVKGLVDNGVKQIMTFLYDYDNGRVPESVHYIMWLDNDNGHMKIITGCDKNSIKDTTFFTEIHKLFDYYKLNRIDTITRQLKAEVWKSHDMGYYITVYLPGKNKQYNIRDYERGLGYKTYEQLIDTTKPNYLTDPRVKWVNMFEGIIKQN